MKRVVSNLNTILVVFLALIVVHMVLFIALRNPIRASWSGRSYYKLSEKSLSLLEKLDERVKVTVFFSDDHKFIQDRDLENLLEEYEYHSDGLIQTEWVDPAKDRARTEMLKNKYGLTEPRVVVFDLGGKTQVVGLSDLADEAMVDGRREPVITHFKGEQAFSSALQGLMQDDVPVAYFLVGHGERRITDFDQVIGYSDIKTAIENDNVEVKELLLGAEQQVPQNAAVVVVAGPLKNMSSIEVEMIEDYLNRGGRVFVLLDALKDGGLEPMLRRWGVEIKDDYVVDPDLMLSGRDLRVKEFNAHPISMKLRTIVQFVLPRSISVLSSEESDGAEDRPAVIPLMFTSDKGWSETQVEQASVKFDEGTGDKMGPISLAVVVERGAMQKMLDVQINPSRMVVIGDADFVSNGAMVAGNQDLFMSSLNWLLDREELMAISPKPIEDVKISLTQKQLNRQMLLNVVGIPAVAMIFGLAVWMRRRK